MSDGSQAGTTTGGPVEYGLHLPRSLYEAMIAHAQREDPLECCGLLGGRRGVADSVHPLRNADSSPSRYSADPQDLIDAVRAIRDRGAEVVAIYHSHPRWPAVPSRTDLRENYWGDVPRPIISLLGPRPVMRVWRLGEDSYEELPWRLLDAEPSTTIEDEGLASI